MAKHGLGSGLDALFADNLSESASVTSVGIDMIVPDENQTRKFFSDEAIAELADSIRVHGIISPLIVRPVGDKYMLIAGERRLRASKAIGLTELPVIIKDVSDREAAEIALIENLQREDLNPIEEASGYRKLLDDFGLTQEELAKRIGKSRPAIANALRLLELPNGAKLLLESGIISSGHARALLPVKDPEVMREMLNDIMDKDKNVREVEQDVRKYLELEAIKSGELPPKGKRERTGENSADASYLAELREISDRIGTALGRSVKLIPGKQGAGKLVLGYYDSDDLEEILNLLGAENAIGKLS